MTYSDPANGGWTGDYWPTPYPWTNTAWPPTSFISPELPYGWQPRCGRCSDPATAWERRGTFTFGWCEKHAKEVIREGRMTDWVHDYPRRTFAEWVRQQPQGGRQYRDPDPSCPICGGEGWVCEDHPDRAWGYGDGCCMGAGMLCKCRPPVPE